MKSTKTVSISKKLIALLVTIIILPTTFLGVINYRTASTITENEIRNAAVGIMNNTKGNIDSFMQTQEENLFIVSKNANIRNILSKKPEEMVYVYDVLQGYVEGHKVIMNIYVGQKDKKMVLYPNQELPAGFDPTARPWYTAATSRNKMIWTEPYSDASSGKLIVTLAIPLYDDNKEFVGVLGADISLEQLTGFIGKTKIGNKGYISLMNSKGVILTHPDKALIGKELPVAELKQEVLASESGNKDYVYKNEKKCAYYTTIGNTGWKVLGIFNYGEIGDKTNYILKICIISGLIIVLIAIILGVMASRPIVKSIKILAEDMMKIGIGDFTVRTTVKSRDEIGLLAKTMNKMSEELGQLMTKVKGTATEVTSSADSLAASSEEVTASTEEISRTVIGITNATVDEAQNIQHGLDKTTELAGNIQKVSETINIIKDIVNKSNGLNEKGINTVEGLRIVSNQNNEAAAKVGEAIEEVDKCSQQINEIINAISSIAGQTNLLALNASIEAARAGEAGRGFAVVAEEIRKLAEQSAMSTKNIQNLIKEIQAQSRNAVGSMETAKPIVEAQSQAVNETRIIFKEISDTIRELTYEVNGITNLNGRMIESKNEIIAIMKNIYESSEENSVSTQKVSASAQEQLAGMEEVARTAEQLNILANSLSSEIEKFKV